MTKHMSVAVNRRTSFKLDIFVECLSSHCLLCFYQAKIAKNVSSRSELALLCSMCKNDVGYCDEAVQQHSDR